MDVIRQWLSNKINNKEIGIYLKETLSVMKIAIYGAGELGELLYDDINGYLGLDVLYFIDKNADNLYYGIDDVEILNLEELRYAKCVDAILITPYQMYNQIKAELEDILDYNPLLVSLEDIIYSVE